MTSTALTQEELDIINDLGTIWNRIVALPVEHPSELPEAKVLVHGLQRLVMARPTRRYLRKRGL